MVWKIAAKEFLLNLMTFKFAVGAVACAVLTVVFMPILAADYRQRLETYSSEMTRNETELRQTKAYRNLRPTVYRPPAMLSAFSGGIEKQLVGAARIELDTVPELSLTERQGNPYLPVFSVFDESLIFKIVISVLALLVAYDVISGEKEQGTLKLMLSGATARHQVLMGKLLAGIATLSVPVVITFVIALVILLHSPTVALGGAEWARIGLMFLASLMFTLVMYQLGFLFSCLAKRSAVSMVLGLFAWIIFAVVVPNACVHLATQIQPLESQEQKEGLIASLQNALADELKAVRVDWASVERYEKSGDDDSFGGWHEKLIDQGWLDAERKSNASEIPIKVRYADRLWDVEHRHLEACFRQRQIANRLSRISPISTYENVMAVLAGTDLTSFQHFISGVRAHRNQVLDYVRLKTDNFSSASFLAGCTEEDAAEFTRLFRREEQAQNEADKAKAKQARETWAQNKRAQAAASLSLQDFPWFRYHPSLVADLQKAMPDLLVLVVTNVVLFGMCFAAFVRYDVR